MSLKESAEYVLAELRGQIEHMRRDHAPIEEIEAVISHMAEIGVFVPDAACDPIPSRDDVMRDRMH